ncbi:MAG: amidohydrolase family protein [Planctomycetota bacterium]
MNVEPARRRIAGGLTIAASLIVPAVCAPTLAAAPVRLVVADHVAPDGTLGGPIAIEIDRGTIVSVGTPDEDEPAIAGVLSPGIIDIFSGVGVTGGTRDDIKPIADDITAMDAIDPLHPSFAEAAAAGITAVMVGPTPSNPVSGLAVTVSTHADGGVLDVLNDESAMVFSLGPPAVDTRYGPTSRAGILFAIRAAMEESGEDSMLGRVAEAGLPAIVFCPDGDDAAQAIQMMGGFGLSPNIVHSRDALDLSSDLEDYEGTFIIGPYTFDARPDVLAGAGFLDRAGVRVVSHGATSNQPYDSIRMTATLASGYGLAPDAARRSFTSEAAALAGVDDLTGSIREGFRADLVLWSGDPLRADVQPQRVWVYGDLMYQTPAEGSAP